MIPKSTVRKAVTADPIQIELDLISKYSYTV